MLLRLVRLQRLTKRCLELFFSAISHLSFSLFLSRAAEITRATDDMTFDNIYGVSVRSLSINWGRAVMGGGWNARRDESAVNGELRKAEISQSDRQLADHENISFSEHDWNAHSERLHCSQRHKLLDLTCWWGGYTSNGMDLCITWSTCMKTIHTVYIYIYII